MQNGFMRSAVSVIVQHLINTGFGDGFSRHGKLFLVPFASRRLLAGIITGHTRLQPAVMKGAMAERL